MAEQQMQYDDGEWSRIVEVDEPYTPTDEEVREHFAYGCGPQHTWDESRAGFDRWLAERDARVRAEERERCAQIAEDYAGGEPINSPHHDDWQTWRAGRTIARSIRQEAE